MSSVSPLTNPPHCRCLTLSVGPALTTLVFVIVMHRHRVAPSLLHVVVRDGGDGTVGNRRVTRGSSHRSPGVTEGRGLVTVAIPPLALSIGTVHGGGRRRLLRRGGCIAPRCLQIVRT